jgi:hypothetical protein
MFEVEQIPGMRGVIMTRGGAILAKKINVIMQLSVSQPNNIKKM